MREPKWARASRSPALWRNSGEVAPDTFDSSDDFDQHDVFTREAELNGIPIRIDIGNNESFTPAVEQFRSELNVTPEGGVFPGSHDVNFWMRVAGPEIEFLGTNLA